MRAAKELPLSDRPATKPPEESMNQTPQGTTPPPTVASQHFEDPMNTPHQYEVVDQQGENKEQMASEYATIPDIERPYDLPLTCYLSPVTTTGEYTQLTHTYENQQAVLQSGTHAVN